jgi:TonB family protein
MSIRILSLSVAIVFSGATVLDAQDSGTNPNHGVQIVPGSCHAPIFPDSLRAAHVEGRVTIRAVVGADGRIEAATVQITASTNHLFDSAARVAFLSCGFVPARVAGKPVRQIVQQGIVFALPKRSDSVPDLD